MCQYEFSYGKGANIKDEMVLKLVSLADDQSIIVYYTIGSSFEDSSSQNTLNKGIIGLTNEDIS